MSEPDSSDFNSNRAPSDPPRLGGKERVSLWISRARAFIERRRVVLRVVLVILGLGLIAFLLRSPAQDRKWAANIQGALTAGLRILADPSYLPELLFGIALFVVLALWWLPKRQAERSRGLSDDNRFDRENEARKTLAQIIGGIFVLAGLYSSVKTFDLQRDTENLQEQGQITDRFTKAIDQLGATAPGGPTDANGAPNINLVVRLGGIYALERIAQDSPRDHWPIMEVLTAYVRENSPMKDQAEPAPGKHTPSGATGHPSDSATLPPPVRADIQAVLTVIGRRDPTRDPQGRRLDLKNTNLFGAQLEDAHLEKAILDGADLEGADLEGAHLEGADLEGANLEDADLYGAHLERAHLDTAIGLTDSQLAGALGDNHTILRPRVHYPDSWKR
jgi:hypothetical protein